MISMIAGMSVTSVSCSPESTSPFRSTAESKPSVVQSAQSLQDQYAWTGKYHNDALAYATERIKESKRISKYDQCKVGLAALKDFQKAFRKSGGNAVFDDLTITEGMCEAAVTLTNRVVATRDLDPQTRVPLADISPLANDYMNQITYQIDLAPSVEYLGSIVSQLISQAGYSVDPLEAAAVATSGSITVSSAGYWASTEGIATAGEPAPYARSGEMSAEIPENFTPRFVFGLSPRSKKIIKADAAAAVGVLLKEWFTGEAAVAKACITAAAASLIAGIFAS
jgi:hypothetical protein